MKIIRFLLIALLLNACQQQRSQKTSTTDPAVPSTENAREHSSSPDPHMPKLSVISGSQRDSLLKRGVEIAMNGQKLLGFHLMRALEQNGTLSALEFCNLQAIPLTDSVSRINDARVARVSDKYRNPANAATDQEIQLIRSFQKDLNTGKEPAPVLQTSGDSTSFYYPLITNTLCLNCHGTPEEMDRDVRNRILQLYPKDLATGYSENQVRGIWKIRFKN